METKEQILRLLDRYLEQFPAEKDRTEPLVRFVNTHEGNTLINRKNFTGHITTSAFIIDAKARTLLLLNHKSLNRWLQPGGHVDDSDASLIASALREACEETGLEAATLEVISRDIFDVDSHRIPDNLRKQEPAHTHHDIRFLFKCIASTQVNISLEESIDSKWIPFVELEGDKDFGEVIKKIQV